MKLELKFALNCPECDHAMDPVRKVEAQITLRLFGLKRGWRVCRCWERIISTIKGVRVYRDIVGECTILGPGGNPFEHLPDGDVVIIQCPPGAAADALTHGEWGKR